MPDWRMIAVAFALALLARPATAGQCTARPGDGQLLIRARLLRAAGPVRPGDVLVDPDGRIDCVGPTCRGRARGATIIDCPRALLSPGFVNLHEHLAYGGIAPHPDDGVRYTHRHDWRKGLNGFRAQGPSRGTSDPALLAWFELRHLLGGETAIAGGAMAPGLARNLDFASGLEGLDALPVSYETFPLDDAAGIEREHDCDYGPKPETAAAAATKHALVIHLAEGTGEAARNEFRCTSSTTYDILPTAGGGGTSQDILRGNVTIVHGIALDGAMLAWLARRGVDLIWSPRSNLSLYGRTLDVAQALSAGLTIALGTDWLPSGSMTLTREAACALEFSRTQGLRLSGRLLWSMMTVNGAHAARMGGRIGVLSEGAVGDLILVREPANRGDPYLAVATARPGNILAVIRGGRILAADEEMARHLPVGSCERVAMAGVEKRICVQDDSGFTYRFLQRRAAAAGVWPAIFADRPPVEANCRPSAGR